MSIAKLPGGTRGGRTPPAWLVKLMLPLAIRWHRRSGDQFKGLGVLYLTTVGARSGEQRTHPVARFGDGEDGWVVVASYGGAAKHPGWYHNIVAHPDQVWAEVDGVKHRVRVEQLEGEARRHAWARVVARAPVFHGYAGKTDRPLPVLQLRPAG
ncbi:MAG TPA: nitroreductase/quinone reductase family protein [Dermatophilaceae bacterium]|nr:nitroreductase/quinone reductase family protein [Dermatophilaceae bacterium]